MWHAYEGNSDRVLVANERGKLKDSGLDCRAILTEILSCDKVDWAHLIQNRSGAVWCEHGKKPFRRSCPSEETSVSEDRRQAVSQSVS